MGLAVHCRIIGAALEITGGRVMMKLSVVGTRGIG